MIAMYITPLDGGFTEKCMRVSYFTPEGRAAAFTGSPEAGVDVREHLTHAQRELAGTATEEDGVWDGAETSAAAAFLCNTTRWRSGWPRS